MESLNRIDATLAAAMGLDADRLARVFAVLDGEMKAGAIPGAAVSIGRNGRFMEFAVGRAVAHGYPPVRAAADTIYDCASLTKVVVTLPLILQLLEEGKLRLDDPLALHLPAFAGDGKEAVTIRRLLTHTAGLAPFADLHSHGWTRERIVDFVLAQPLQYEPGSRVVYSDLGYILLGHLASRLLAAPLERLAADRIFGPLGMKDSGFNPPAALRGRIAATERYPNEDRPRLGTVHDENARAMGGVSGHAGLFSTARDLARYAAMWLEGGSLEGRTVLSPASVGLAIRPQSGAAEGGCRGLGWALKGDRFDASGDLLSPASYGHTGFTGTSLYVDPVLRLTVVLLTNRVHYGRDRSVERLRALVHNVVAASVLGVADSR
jgi:CubicO group peptidase (beta-lactamase class C family)